MSGLYGSVQSVQKVFMVQPSRFRPGNMEDSVEELIRKVTSFHYAYCFTLAFALFISLQFPPVEFLNILSFLLRFVNAELVKYYVIYYMLCSSILTNKMYLNFVICLSL